MLQRLGLSDGMPIFLDDETMMPVEPLCSWGRSMSYAELAEGTMRDYGRIMRRFGGHQTGRGRDVLSATEADLVAYKRLRTQEQEMPIGASAWSKESSVLDRFFSFAVEQGLLERRPMRVAARGRNALSPRTRRGMDIRHLSLEQYRYFRDVGLGGQGPDSGLNPSFRGSSPHRDRAGADLAVCSGMRWQEWATVLLPELGMGRGTCAEEADFRVQACAKYGKERGIFVPEQAMQSVETYCLLERPEFTAAAARSLERRHRDLFVVSRVDVETGRIHGVLDGMQRVLSMKAMPPRLRRITVWEGEFGLEALAVFLCRGGLMPGADSWKRYRHAAWRRMMAQQNPTTPKLPARRWRWHDLRHTYALQLLTYLEQQMDGAEPDPIARRRRHRSYLSGHIRYNPLLIVSRRLGHSSPETTYAYLEYTDDLLHEFDAAFAEWLGDPEGGATYAQIAARAYGVESSAVGVC
ncbi:tyrosine-type recombinase/integrase [Streptomyces sp. NPDC090022]|uniref:tyrosine-type recombinase/integrase n=1 Tax=Streptomyces sp. NPDC090022 TaxID=3365920 RepID=UPI0038001345